MDDIPFQVRQAGVDVQHGFTPAEPFTPSTGKEEDGASFELKDKTAKTQSGASLGRQIGSIRSMNFEKRRAKLEPALKSWLDNVIIPALVREYLAEIEKHNRLATPAD